MKLFLPLIALGTLCLLTSTPRAAEPPVKSAVDEINKVCPVTGKPADPKVTTVYEGKTYAFEADAPRTQWVAAREKSLYHRLGGKPSIDAAVELFYKKVLADDRIKAFFDDINMNAQRRKQKAFLSAAFGGPEPWTGKDMRKAHANLPGLTEAHFNAVAENLQKTLEELKVPRELITEVLTIAASTRDDVLNRKPAEKK